MLSIIFYSILLYYIICYFCYNVQIVCYRLLFCYTILLFLLSFVILFCRGARKYFFLCQIQMRNMAHNTKNNKSNVLPAVIVGGGLLFLLCNSKKQNKVLSLEDTIQENNNTLKSLVTKQQAEEEKNSWAIDTKYYNSLKDNFTFGTPVATDIVPRIIPNSFIIREVEYTEQEYIDGSENEYRTVSKYKYKVQFALEIYVPKDYSLDMPLQMFGAENIKFGGQDLFQIGAKGATFLKKDEYTTAQREKMVVNKTVLKRGFNYFDCFFYAPVFETYSYITKSYDIPNPLYLEKQNGAKLQNANSFSFDLVLKTDTTQQKRWKLTIKQVTDTNKTQFGFESGYVTTFQNKDFFSFSAPLPGDRKEFNEFMDVHESDYKFNVMFDSWAIYGYCGL